MTKLSEMCALSADTAETFGIVERDDGWEYPSPDDRYKRWKNYESDGQPKYLWKPKGAPGSDLVYGLSLHALPGMLYLVEGEKDVWTMTEAELPAVSFMAGAGTPPSTVALARLKMAMVEPFEIRICYDRDEPGDKGAVMLYALLKANGFKVRRFLIPEKLGDKADVSTIWLDERDAEMFRLIVASLEEWEPERPPPFWTSNTDWMKEGATEIAYVVDGLLPARSVVLLTGHWSSGKSWLLADIGISLATNRPVLGHFQTLMPGASMLCDQDSQEDDQRRRYSNLMAGYSLNGASLAPMQMAFYRGIDIASDEWGERILAAIDELELKVLMFDALIRFHHVNENSPTDMSVVMERMRQFAQAGPCVIISHHLGKPKEGVSGGHLIRGAGDIVAMADLAFGVTAGHATEDTLGQEFYVQYLKPPRFGPKPSPFVYVVHGPAEGPNTVRYKGEMELPEEASSEQAKAFLYQYLPACQPQRRNVLKSELMRALGCKPRLADKMIDELYADGVLVKPGRGLYSLAESGLELEDEG